jgi:hypothetical protein
VPWADRYGSSVAVKPVDEQINSPWRGISVLLGADGHQSSIGPNDWLGLISAADASAATELVVMHDENSLLVGRLAQKRYWSDTQARLLAQRIVWSHLKMLKGRASA